MRCIVLWLATAVLIILEDQVGQRVTVVVIARGGSGSVLWPHSTLWRIDRNAINAFVIPSALEWNYAYNYTPQYPESVSCNRAMLCNYSRIFIDQVKWEVNQDKWTMELLVARIAVVGWTVGWLVGWFQRQRHPDAAINKQAIRRQREGYCGWLSTLLILSAASNLIKRHHLLYSILHRIHLKLSVTPNPR